MPAFCRHNRLIQNCAICSREQGTVMNPVVTSSAPKSSEPRERAAPVSADRLDTGDKRPRSSASRSTGRGGGMKVRRLERGADDGYASGLIQGCRSSADAERLAEELAFATARLVLLSEAPPATFAAITDTSLDLEERTWNAVQWELGVGEEQRVSWASGETAGAYRAWAERAGSQQTAFTGEAYWTPERRFERIFERLGTLGVLDRDQRFDLLVVLGRLGLYELEAGKLFPAGENETTWAAKRALGIGDPLLLERRSADLAGACGIPLAALDLGFHNWGVGAARRTGRGVSDALEPDADVLAAVRGALGL